MSDYPEDDIPVLRSERSTATVKHRKYRTDKRHPQKIKITVEEDLGKIEQVQQFYFHANTQRRTRKKQKNPELVYIIKSPIRIAYYINSKKMYCYSQEGLFLGELEKGEQKRIFSAFGLILRHKKTKGENNFGKILKSRLK